jgi:DNA polymerase-3 subunit gamma/tau
VAYKQARNKRLHVEMALIKMTFIARAITPAAFQAPLIPEKKVENSVLVADSRQQTVSAPNVQSAATVQKDSRETALSASRQDSPELNVPPVSKGSVAQYPQPTERQNLAAEEAPMPTASNSHTEVLPNAAVPSVHSASKAFALMPKIGSLDAIAAQIEEEEALLKQVVSKLNLENLQESWKKYAESHESPSTKSALSTAQLSLKGKKATAKVGTEFMVGMIQSENKLPEFLRFDLNDPALTLEIVYDKSLAPEEIQAPPPKRYLSPREKLKLMMEVNPLVKDFAIRMNLKPDE